MMFVIAISSFFFKIDVFLLALKTFVSILCKGTIFIEYFAFQA
jgi:hypothetical protein